MYNEKLTQNSHIIKCEIWKKNPTKLKEKIKSCPRLNCTLLWYKGLSTKRKIRLIKLEPQKASL